MKPNVSLRKLFLMLFVLAGSPTVAMADVSTIIAQTADLGDVKLHYLKSGTGPAVILIHGYTQTSRMWRPVIPTLAKRFKTPYPIVLVIAGLFLSLIPHMPRIELNPEVVFLLFLPPLLFSAAFQTSWRDFRFNISSIALLALGLVSFTVYGVAFASHWILPDFTWRLGLVLGAVICTTDAIAASKTAAAPTSFARPIPSRRSSVTSSARNSIAEFSASVTQTKAIATTIAHHSNRLSPQINPKATAQAVASK